MKNILTSILMLLFFGASAQMIDISVSGTVKDVNDVPLKDVFVQVYGDFEEGYVYGFTDVDGKYSFDFNAYMYGCAFVSIMDCEFIPAENDLCWEDVAQEYESDFTYCESGFLDSFCHVFIYLEQPFPDVYDIIAIPQGLPPFNFEWSTGATSPNLVVQDEGTYCVSITYGDGCISEECYEVEFPSPCESYIYHDGFPNQVILGVDSYGVPPFLYEWSTGETGFNILVSEPGEYCVTVTDDEGCIDVACDFVDIIIDSSFCDSWINHTIEDNGDIVLTIEAYGLGPFDYLWDNGETSQSITVAEGESHCVIVTDTNGCESYPCYEYYGPCGVDISCDPVPNGVWLFSLVWGEWPYTYSWSTGDTTESIQIIEEGEYCVTIVDAVGCESSNCFYADPGNNPFDSTCFVNIYEEFEENGSFLNTDVFGIEVEEFQWDNGESGPSIFVEDEGEYCLEVIFTNGCIANACYYFIPHKACEVFVGIENTGTESVLTPYPYGMAPFTFEWSTGEFTEQISITDEGIYCVTMTDADGCVSDFCNDFYPYFEQDSLCFAYIEVEINNDYAELTAIGSGVEPFLYEWSNGETGQVTGAYETGNYCVTIYDGFQCESVACYYHEDVDPTSAPRNAIFGFVFSNMEQLEAEVFLYSVNELYKPIDSVMIHDVFELGILGYEFTNLPAGEYMVKAVPINEDFIPTYFESSLLWEEATVVELELDGYVSADIALERANGGSGPGIINGNVTSSGLWEGNGGSSSREEKGVPDLTILLMSEYNVPVAFQMTDQNGIFRFTDLPLGRYKLITEEAGVEHKILWVTLTEDDFIVDVYIEFGDGLSANENINDISRVVSIYPNPVSETLNIQIDENIQKIERLEVIDLLGKTHNALLDLDLYSNGQLQLNVSNLQTGQYILKLEMKDKTATKMFLKI